jgi:cytochrome P450 / NADPH-cytochrome P450 reductase
MASTMPIPQPRGLPLIGNVAELSRDTPVQSMMRMARRYGPIFRIRLFNRSMILVSSQELAAELCDDKRFDKGLHPALEQMRALGGDGLFTAYSGEANWGKAHRLLTPAFGPLGLRGMFDRMLDIASQLVVKWERFGDKAVFDVADNMTRLTLDTIALCAFDYRFNSFYQIEMHPFVAAMLGALHGAADRARRPDALSRLMWWRDRRVEADAAVVRGVADQLIAERRRDPMLGQRADLLDVMLTAQDRVTGEKLSDENIRSQLMTFLIAGHETTSGLLSFAIWFFLTNPEVLAAAQAQVDNVLGADPPTIEHLARLRYIEQVLMETLRLWPTAPAFALRPLQPTVIGGRYEVTPDDILLLLLPMLHRDPAIWDQPEAFRPARFAPKNLEKLPPHAWKPFGTGRRSCIGRGFAMQEAALVLAMILQRFDISLADPDYRLKVGETLTMKPVNLRIHARRREPPVRRPRRAAASSSEATPHSGATVVPASGAHRPLLILFGSNTGSSEAFARRIAADAAAHGYDAAVAAMDDHADGLPADTPLVVVTATYDGRAPRNAGSFIAWIEAQPEGALAGRPFVVFGCGNRQWMRTFQAVPKRVDAALARLGAKAFTARGEADAAGDFAGDFERWYAGFWPALAAAGPADAAIAPRAADPASGAAAQGCPFHRAG